MAAPRSPDNAAELFAQPDIDGFLVGGASLDPESFTRYHSAAAADPPREVLVLLYVLYTIHVIICLFLIMVVLLQQGKGADLSVFGGGGTQTAFGARGAATLLAQAHRVLVSSPSSSPPSASAFSSRAVLSSSVMSDVAVRGSGRRGRPPTEPTPVEAHRRRLSAWSELTPVRGSRARVRAADESSDPEAQD